MRHANNRRSMKSLVRTIGMMFAVLIVLAGHSGCSSSSSAQGPVGVVNEVAVGGIPRSAAILGSGLVVFVLQDDTFDNEPWVTDGTTAGTFKLADVMTVLQASAAAGRTTFMVNHDLAYFFAEYGDLWVTDGTIAGTELFVDMTPDGFYFTPDAVSRDNNELIVGGCRDRIDGTPTPLDCSILTIMLD